MLDKIINLSSLVQEAKNGEFDTIRELEREFTEIRKTVNKYKRMAKEAFEENNKCTHAQCSPPYYQVQRRMVDYVYIFQKDCLKCGKHFYIHDKYSERSLPEGYDGAESRSYSNSILGGEKDKV